ncbi:2-aminoethanethiol (cysteamine) dioxygenase a [Callorhinchus milii]|uniref:2-aminoethanethiol (cysteamine) dioxygenase a n=1 Tax=Callorhinchus milii TaxID=7868 RepID=V9KXP3_CALMI|nr:2-aminoethanethiol (cysteamine) dioxygenase a [Callorhinchus milii]|eukprot:gi/632936583/ref/XP_007895409.1/ PREDICTED: 2-aminoethanethiol dioxygenase [Callorhinchus milii]
MPLDNMASLIQKVANQARTTFKAAAPLSLGDRVTFHENLANLKGLLGEVRAEDLNIRPRRSADSPPVAPRQRQSRPPVTYMHISETEGFSMGVFLLDGGTCIPLHDHPGMHGLLKVIYGKVQIQCFDRLEKGDGPGAASGLEFSSPLPQGQREALRGSVLRSSHQFDEAHGACVLSPDRDNLHEISAVDGPAAFLDVLAPPYCSAEGRDCHYYRVLEVSGSGGKAGPEPAQPPRHVWLLEVPQPVDFWCDAEPYPGPPVAL